MNFDEQSWQEVVELLDTAIFVTDEAHRVLYANGAALALILGTQTKITGKQLGRLVPALAAFLDSQTGSPNDTPQAVHLDLPDGTRATFRATMRRRRREYGGFQVSLQPAPEAVAGAKPATMAEASSSVSALMPTFLHELKNPLAAIATSVELLLEELPTGSVRHELMAIYGEIRRMKLVLDGVGIMGRQLRTQTRWPVQESLQEACLVLQPLAKRKGIHFETNIPKYAPLPFDASVLKAVLFNLVMNAIHACNKGQTIKVSSVVVNNALRIAVEDNGQGMSRETLEQATRLFFTTKPFGSGIGLALCQEVAHEANGSLDIISAEGVGTRVTFEVPLHLDQADDRSKVSSIGGEE